MSHNEQLNQNFIIFCINPRISYWLHSQQSRRKRKRKREKGSITLFLEKYRKSYIVSLTRSLARKSSRECEGSTKERFIQGTASRRVTGGVGPRGLAAGCSRGDALEGVFAGIYTAVGGSAADPNYWNVRRYVRKISQKSVDRVRKKSLGLLSAGKADFSPYSWYYRPIRHPIVTEIWLVSTKNSYILFKIDISEWSLINRFENAGR